MALGMRHKLRSEQGASMMMALFLFLVCTTVAAVVLAAGTAAAGRISELRETNRRYYGVTSAASVFNDLLHDVSWGQNKVTITRSCKIKETRAVGGSCSYELVAPSEQEWKIYVAVDNNFAGEVTPTSAPNSLFVNLALDYMFTNSGSGSLANARHLSNTISNQVHLSASEDELEKLSFDSVFRNPSFVGSHYEAFKLYGVPSIADTWVTTKIDENANVLLTFSDEQNLGNSAYKLNLSVPVSIDESITRFELLSETGSTRVYRMLSDTTFLWIGGEISV